MKIKKMEKDPLMDDEKQRRLLQEYIFNLEDAQEKTEELTLVNEKLNKYGHYLEKLVAARTDELIKANQKLQEEINERRQKEKELLNLEELESSILDAIPHAVFGLKDHSIVFANKGVKNVFGWDAEEMLGKSSRLFYSSDEEFENADKIIYPVLEQQKTFSHEVYLYRKDGTQILCRINMARIGNSLVEKKVVAIIEDITDYRHAEKEKENLQSQLLQAQKLEAVGKLAGGIAHDFNNILGAIIGYANIIQIKMPANDALRTYIDHIVTSSQKAANLTKGLLAFSRKQIIDPKPLELNQTIFKMGKFLSRLIPEDVELKTILYDEDLIVLADAGQIDQVIMNLVTNARDSLSNGGIIEISVGKFLIDNGFKITHGYGEPGEYALISLTDNGAGMDGEIIKKIFEPFFTTKEVGKGTGLGLSIVYGIIKQHGGYIEVQSEPNCGTIFNIYLPL
ncbi:MAG: ATP-binding protein, partial [Smithella sp.]